MSAGVVRTLVVGARDSNIGAAVVNRIKQDAAGEMDWGQIISAPNQDMMDLTSVQQVQRYVMGLGPFDRIVYCAGVNRLNWIQDLNHKELMEHYKVNVFGLVEIVATHLTAFPDTLERVVAVVSDSSRVAMRGSLAYSSSKAALVGVLKNMARELASAGVTVVGVSPGIVEGTPMTENIDSSVPGFRGWEPQAAREYEKSMIPMGRRARVDEVVDTIMFALDGPKYLSGSIIELTGGK